MPTMTTTQTLTNTLKIAPKVQRQILTELQAYASLSAEQKVLKADMDAARINVLDIGTRELDPSQYKFEMEGFKVSLLTDQVDRRLDKDKLKKLLISEGLSLKKIDALFLKATTEKPKKSYAKITCPGGEDDE